jgi:pimeloyl-ACP methyl ester carboxylesterase
MVTSHKIPLILVPGVIAPAQIRYAALIAALGPGVNAVAKDLEVYAGPSIPEGYHVDTEVEGISRKANQAGFDRFHLYGYSGGGACSLAYVAAHPERVLSLAVDEPATDFSAEDRAEFADFANRTSRLSSEEDKFVEFVRLSLRPGAQLPPQPEGPPPAWMATRPAGIKAMMSAFLAYRVDTEGWRNFENPVYYSFGSLSTERCDWMRDRLARMFPHLTSELYQGLHHFNPSMTAEPQRVAAALRKLWSTAPVPA